MVVLLPLLHLQRGVPVLSPPDLVSVGPDGWTILCAISISPKSVVVGLSIPSVSDTVPWFVVSEGSCTWPSTRAFLLLPIVCNWVLSCCSDVCKSASHLSLCNYVAYSSFMCIIHTLSFLTPANTLTSITGNCETFSVVACYNVHLYLQRRGQEKWREW